MKQLHTFPAMELAAGDKITSAALVSAIGKMGLKSVKAKSGKHNGESGALLVPLASRGFWNEIKLLRHRLSTIGMGLQVLSPQELNGASLMDSINGKTAVAFVPLTPTKAARTAPADAAPAAKPAMDMPMPGKAVDAHAHAKSLQRKQVAETGLKLVGNEAGVLHYTSNGQLRDVWWRARGGGIEAQTKAGRTLRGKAASMTEFVKVIREWNQRPDGGLDAIKELRDSMQRYIDDERLQNPAYVDEGERGSGDLSYKLTANAKAQTLTLTVILSWKRTTGKRAFEINKRAMMALRSEFTSFQRLFASKLSFKETWPKSDTYFTKFGGEAGASVTFQLVAMPNTAKG